MLAGRVAAAERQGTSAANITIFRWLILTKWKSFFLDAILTDIGAYWSSAPDYSTHPTPAHLSHFYFTNMLTRSALNQ